MKRVVVTGATSMIGCSLIRCLQNSDEIEKIYAVVRRNCQKLGRIDTSDCRVEIIECDLHDICNLSNMINDRCDTFYHLAWPRTATYNESFEDILQKWESGKNVIDALVVAINIGCNKFIGAGSQSEYGITDQEYFENSYCNPVRADGMIHLAAGTVASLIAKNAGIDFVWMRIFSIYGKYDRMNSMIMDTVCKLLKREECSFTPAEQMWDYLHEDDAGRAFFAVGSDNVRGIKIYNVASGISKPLRCFIRDIYSCLDLQETGSIGALPYPNNPVNMIVNVDALKVDTGWTPKVCFKDGLNDIIHYMERNSI